LLNGYEKKFDIMSEMSLALSTGDATPDVVMYPASAENWERDSTKESDPPITAIEILSPTQAVNDLIEKARNIYFPAGVRSVWIVIPPLKSIYTQRTQVCDKTIWWLRPEPPVTFDFIAFLNLSCIYPLPRHSDRCV
jgi:Uma2 family endonuclease